jgi:hypothetical protein
MKIIIGIIIGWLSMYVFLIIAKNLKQKKGAKEKDYSKLPFTTQLRDSIRHIVFEYNIKRKNNDFLLNIILKNDIVMQIMHRSHFPELCQSESDVAFGLALYIPISHWPKDRVAKLNEIVEEESEVAIKNRSGQLEFHVIDLGTRVRFGGYFLHRIIKEVFEGDENNFNSELFSEGNLPYWHN